MGTGFFFPWDKAWLRRDADHSPPSTAKVKKERGYTSSTPSAFHGVSQFNFTFTVSEKSHLYWVLGYPNVTTFSNSDPFTTSCPIGNRNTYVPTPVSISLSSF
jgi:hypothetical protein